MGRHILSGLPMLFDDDLAECGVGTLPGWLPIDEDTDGGVLDETGDGFVGEILDEIGDSFVGEILDEIGDSFVGEVLSGIFMWWDGVEVLTGFSADEGLWSLLRFGMGDCGSSGGVVAGRKV